MRSQAIFHTFCQQYHLNPHNHLLYKTKAEFPRLFTYSDNIAPLFRATRGRRCCRCRFRRSCCHRNIHALVPVVVGCFVRIFAGFGLHNAVRESRCFEGKRIRLDFRAFFRSRGFSFRTACRTAVKHKIGRAHV